MQNNYLYFLRVILMVCVVSASHVSGVDLPVVNDSKEVPQPTSQSEAAEMHHEITILHVNDTHSHISQDHFVLNPEDLGLELTDPTGTSIDRVKVPFGGYPRIVALFNEEATSVRNVIKVHAGDTITGTPYYTLFKGPEKISPDALMMNLICFDAFVIGNHEFDDGDLGLADFLMDLAAGDCTTEVLSANLEISSSSPLAEAQIKPFTVIEMGKSSMGVIGITIKNKTEVSSNPDPGTALTDEISAAQSSIDALTALGVEHIMLLTHNQYDRDIKMANLLSGVDVIVGGDSHTLLGDETFSDLGLNVSGPYPTLTVDAENRPVCIVHAWENTHIMGQLKVAFYDGTVKDCSGHPVAPIGSKIEYTASDGSTALLSVKYKRLILDKLTAHDEFKLQSVDLEAAALLQEFDVHIDGTLNSFIGTATHDLCLERIPGEGRSNIYGCKEKTQSQGSDITMIVAKAIYEAAGDADMAIQNAGGVRADIPAGAITLRDVYELLPYSNNIVRGEMLGVEILAALEAALTHIFDQGGSTGAFPYVYGMRFDADATQNQGQRISNVHTFSRSTRKWSQIDPEAVYSVVTTSYLSTGGDNYTNFVDVKWKETNSDYRQALIGHIERKTKSGKNIQSISREFYSTQQFIDQKGCRLTPKNCGID